MKRAGFLLGAAVLASLVAVAPASAQCPTGDGTLPGSSASVTAVGTGDATPYGTIYADDRDALDLDDEGDAQGLWIYVESNGTAGLQRGGDHVAAGYVPRLPRIGPIPVVPPNPGGLPILPNGLTLFPCSAQLSGSRCAGGPGVREWALPEDQCRTDASGQHWGGPPDQFLF